MNPLTSRKAWYEIAFLIKQPLLVPVSSNRFPQSEEKGLSLLLSVKWRKKLNTDI